MARPDHPIHNLLVEHAGLERGEVLVDVGCGEGGALLAADQLQAGILCVGVDRDASALATARALLHRAARSPCLIRADLSASLPFAAATVDRIVCHNTLECLPDPQRLLAEAARVLRPGGRAVWSHTDFDALVVNTNDAALTRRVVHAYADSTQPWMQTADGQMGRKLAALVRASPLRLEAVDSHQTTATDLPGDARARIDEITAALQSQAARGVGPLTVDEIALWKQAVERAAAEGSFFFAETAIIALSHRPP